MPKVSVLIPLYNTNLNYLQRTIHSVLQQSYENFEVVLLNDSPDNTCLDQFIKTINDKRITYRKNERNLGISDSRNKLIQMAQGEYLAILDHDDICDVKRLEIQAKYLDTHPSIGVVSSYLQILDTNVILKTAVTDSDIKSILHYTSSIAHPAAMIRKKLLIDNKIRYNSKYTPAEDYLLWVQLADKTEFHNIPLPLTFYRLYSGNTSYIYKEQMTLVTKQIQKIANEVLPKITIIQKLKIKLLLFYFYVCYAYQYYPIRFKTYLQKLHR